MALMKCPECEKEISDKAASCPHCGYQVINISDNKKTAKKKSSTLEGIKKDLFIPIFVLGIIVFLIIGINVSNRSKVSEDMRDYGKRAIEVVDDYLDNDLDYITAQKKLNAICSDASQGIDNSYENDVKVENEIYKVNSALIKSNSDESLRESRNNLAETLGIRKRD